MARIYVQLQVDFDDDPDVAKLARFRRPREARAARELLTSMWRYCKREKSDGHIPIEMVGKLAYPDSEKIALQDAGRLVDIGVAERTETGYYLPGYLKHNKSRAQIEAEIEKKAEAGKKGGLVSGVVRKAEAQTKHSASTGRSQRTEDKDRGQTTENNVTTQEGGDRHLTSVDGRAIWPTHCLDHRYIENPGPCGGCKKTREAAETENERRDRQRADDCRRCGGSGWIEDPDTRKPVRPCDHRETA